MHVYDFLKKVPTATYQKIKRREGVAVYVQLINFKHLKLLHKVREFKGLVLLFVVKKRHNELLKESEIIFTKFSKNLIYI